MSAQRPRTKRFRAGTRGGRDARFEAARCLRAQLVPIRLQREVGEIVGVTRSAVERIELRALARILGAFAADAKEARSW